MMLCKTPSNPPEGGGDGAYVKLLSLDYSGQATVKVKLTFAVKLDCSTVQDFRRTYAANDCSAAFLLEKGCPLV